MSRVNSCVGRRALGQSDKRGFRTIHRSVRVVVMSRALRSTGTARGPRRRAGQSSPGAARLSELAWRDPEEGGAFAGRGRSNLSAYGLPEKFREGGRKTRNAAETADI